MSSVLWFFLFILTVWIIGFYFELRYWTLHPVTFQEKLLSSSIFLIPFAIFFILFFLPFRFLLFKTSFSLIFLITFLFAGSYLLRKRVKMIRGWLKEREEWKAALEKEIKQMQKKK
ncbi:MAG: hypothetical protein ACK4G3_03370 [bacterium]